MLWALVEERTWGMPAEGTVIMEDCQGALPLEEYVQTAFSRPGPGTVSNMRKLIAQIAELFARVHALEIFHKDLKGTNLLVQETGDGWRISIVDLDHVRFGRPLSRKERILNLAQLNASIPSWIGRTERLRFLRVYTKGAPKEVFKELARDVWRLSSRFQWDH
jgi:serine/threonine protein kinase